MRIILAYSSFKKNFYLNGIYEIIFFKMLIMCYCAIMVLNIKNEDGCNVWEVIKIMICEGVTSRLEIFLFAFYKKIIYVLFYAKN